MKKVHEGSNPMGLIVDVIWFRSPWGTPVLELRVNSQRVLAAEHPSLIAGAIYALGVKTVQFINPDGESRRNYTAYDPVNLCHQDGLRSLAGNDEELKSVLTILLATLLYASDLDNYEQDSDMPYALSHWHAACVLLSDDLVVRRPTHPTPADWPEWLGARLHHTYFPRLTPLQRAALGAVDPIFPEVPV